MEGIDFGLISDTLAGHFSEGTEEKHERFNSEQYVSGLGLNPVPLEFHSLECECMVLVAEARNAVFCLASALYM
jgi:hypothetical protein